MNGALRVHGWRRQHERCGRLKRDKSSSRYRISLLGQPLEPARTSKTAGRLRPNPARENVVWRCVVIDAPAPLTTLPPGGSASKGRGGRGFAALPGRYRVRPSRKRSVDLIGRAPLIRGVWGACPPSSVRSWLISGDHLGASPPNPPGLNLDSQLIGPITIKSTDRKREGDLIF